MRTFSQLLTCGGALTRMTLLSYRHHGIQHFHCLPPFRYSVIGSLLRFTHVKMEQAIGISKETMGSRLVPNGRRQYSNQCSTSLGTCQPLVNHGAHSNLLLVDKHSLLACLVDTVLIPACWA